MVSIAFPVLPDRATQRTFSFDGWPRAQSQTEMWLGDAMADIVKYHGCLIIVHDGMTMDLKALGSCEILADGPETAAAERNITRLSTIVETRDVVDDPRLANRESLIEMAKCEIHFIRKTAY